MMNRMRKIFALATLLALVAAPALAAPSPMALLAKLRASLAPVTDLTARFTQTTMLEAAGMEKKVDGKVRLKRGGKMLWEYEGADPQTIACDGAIVWIHQVRDRTAIRKELADISPAARAALDLLGGMSDVEKHFSLSSCGDACVELKPLNPDPDLSLVRLELSGDGLMIKAVVTEDPVGNKTRIELSAVEKNKGLGDALFSFTPPKGVDVFDGQGRKR